MNIGLIGYGYWGKILHKNLNNFNANILIKDLNLNPDIDLSCCDKIFVATPANTHREIVDYYVSRGIDVFCEKPLAIKRTDVFALYNIAEKNNANLFVDWTFTFNDAINFIKSEYIKNTFGNIKSIKMNRSNKGPERFDVSAKWDLASHDVSIVQYIFDDACTSATWKSFSRNKNSKQYDTCIGVLEYNTFDVTIQCSWEYSIKDRLCIFEFENGILMWDDLDQTLKFNNVKLEYPKTKSPLIKSIETFLNNDCNYDQKKLTIDVSNILLMGE